MNLSGSGVSLGITVPTEMLKLRFNYDSQETAPIAAKVKELEAKVRVIQAQK